MPVKLAACPLPEAELGKGKRLPQLAALDDPEERQAAVALAKKTLEAATSLDVRAAGPGPGAGGPEDAPRPSCACASPGGRWTRTSRAGGC